MASFDPSALSSIYYYFDKEVSIEDTKKIFTLVIDPISDKSSGNGITGFAIFSSITGIEDPLLILQIAVILILLIVYIIYEFELLVKIKQNNFIEKINPVLNFRISDRLSLTLNIQYSAQITEQLVAKKIPRQTIHPRLTEKMS